MAKTRGAKIKVTAIIPSAGKGARFISKESKPFAKLDGRPLLSYALKTFQSSALIRDIVLVISSPYHKEASELVKRYGITKVRHIVDGGKTRSDSVGNGLRRVDKDASFILVHDGVRPFVSGKAIRKSIAAAMKFGASVSGVPVKATIKVAGKGDLVKYTPRRKDLWEVQTPQVFRRALIEKAYKKAGRKRSFTDDAALIENIGAKVKIVRGDYTNIKITTKEDIKIAEALLRKR